MQKTNKVTITLNKETIAKLSNYIKKYSINKSALIDRLLNEEMEKNK
jgi:post-segregation antitoxin (ccd killing protein)